MILSGLGRMLGVGSPDLCHHWKPDPTVVENLLISLDKCFCHPKSSPRASYCNAYGEERPRSLG